MYKGATMIALCNSDGDGLMFSNSDVDDPTFPMDCSKFDNREVMTCKLKTKIYYVYISIKNTQTGSYIIAFFMLF